MTVVDILYLPFMLFVIFTISRAPKMIEQLRNGFDNKVRATIIMCTRNAITDILTLPFLLVVLSPLGMVSGRDKPLWRNMSCCTKNEASETAARAQGDHPIHAETFETMTNSELDINRMSTMY